MVGAAPRVVAWGRVATLVFLCVVAAPLGGGSSRPSPPSTPSGLTEEWTTSPDGMPELRASEGGRAVGRLRFSSCNDFPPRRSHTRHGWAAIDVYDRAPSIVEHLIHAARDLGPSAEAPRPCGATPGWPIEIALAALLATLAALAVGLVRRARVTFELRLPHVVPIAIQLLIYAYWSLYWPGVAGHARSLVLQVALAFALEAALAFLVFRSWRVGLGPVPVVLSANLFAWFDPAGSVVVVCAAIASKTLLRRDGKHLINPSAAGLTAGALYLLARPDAGWAGLFHTQTLAPSIVELILLISLLPLLRFRLGLIPLGAALAVSALPPPAPGLTVPGTIIAFALFASDPATTPKTPAGRLLYGLFVGASMVAVSRVLVALGSPDDFSKVLPIPLANLLAPTFDRLASRGQGKLEAQLLGQRWAAAHVALWGLLVLGRFVGSKQGQFDAALHWTYGTPLVVRGPDDVPRCADNPAFCRPFAVASEVSAWLARGRER